MDTEIVWRVALAVGLAAAVGGEREAAGQPAGLRTHISVALGACLFGIISTLGFEEYVARRETTNIQIDVTRVASNVVVGIGFLGAGVIFRQGAHVRNLTTAASIWATAAIGLSAGVGDAAAAAITTVALVAVLMLLRPVRALIVRTLVHDRRRLSILLRPGADADGLLGELHRAERVSVGPVTVVKQDGAPLVEAQVDARPGADLGAVITRLSAREDVVTLSYRDDE